MGVTMRTIIIFLVCVCLVGCAGGCAGHCIKLGAGYEGVAGEVAYCFDQAESDAAGVPAWTITADEATVDKLYGFTKDQVQRIWDKLKGKVKEAVGLSEPSHPVQSILKELDREPGKP